MNSALHRIYLPAPKNEPDKLGELENYDFRNKTHLIFWLNFFLFAGRLVYSIYCFIYKKIVSNGWAKVHLSENRLFIWSASL